MIKELFCPGLLDTKHISEELTVIRDGVVNFYVLKSDSGLICVDTGWRPAHLARSFEKMALRIHDVSTVLLTHLHWDHARSSQSLPNAKVFVSKSEISSPFGKQMKHLSSIEEIQDNQVIKIGGRVVRVIATPGHTAGSVSFLLDDKLLFTGDTLRLKCGKVVPFPFLFNQNGEILKSSIHRLAEIKGVKCLLTSHSGLSEDPENAFSQWNNKTNNLSPDGEIV